MNYLIELPLNELAVVALEKFCEAKSFSARGDRLDAKRSLAECNFAMDLYYQRKLEAVK